jgi:hypothetical protein
MATAADTTVQSSEGGKTSSPLSCNQRIDVPPGTSFDIRTLQIGRWYCIGFKVTHISGEEGDDFGQILLLDSIDEGDRPRGVWVDEDGEVVESVFDPDMQLDVHPDGADFFVVQS